MEGLTARDIGRQIRRPGETLQMATDRVRNWAKMGIIEPIGPKHPGIGRLRLFPPAALLRAVLLQTLSDAYGWSVAGSADYAATLMATLKNAATLKKHGLAGYDFIVLGRPLGGPVTKIELARRGDLERHIERSELELHMVINLKDLLSSMPPEALEALTDKKSLPSTIGAPEPETT